MMQIVLRKIWRMLLKDERNRQGWNLVNKLLQSKSQVKSLNEYLRIMSLIRKLKKLSYKPPEFLNNLYSFTKKNGEKLVLQHRHQNHNTKNQWIQKTKQYLRSENPTKLRIQMLRSLQNQNPDESIQQNWRELRCNQERIKYEREIQSYLMEYIQRLLRAIAESTDNCEVLGHYHQLKQQEKEQRIEYYRELSKSMKAIKLDLRIPIRKLVQDTRTGRVYQAFIDQIIQELSYPVQCQYTKYLQMPVVEFMVMLMSKGKSVINALKDQIKHIYKDNCQCSHLRQCIRIYELKITAMYTPNLKELGEVLGKINSFYELEQKVQLVAFFLSLVQIQVITIT